MHVSRKYTSSIHKRIFIFALDNNNCKKRVNVYIKMLGQYTSDTMNKLIIKTTARKDLPAILDVQKKAFLEVARFFHLKTLPPLEQTLEDVTREFDKGIILKAVMDERIVGSVRAYQKGDTCFIGKLVVGPEYQNKGIGKALMREIENHYRPVVKRYEIFTGMKDQRNRYVYDQLGYKPFKIEKLNDEVTFVYLEKSV